MAAGTPVAPAYPGFGSATPREKSLDGGAGRTGYQSAAGEVDAPRQDVPGANRRVRLRSERVKDVWARPGRRLVMNRLGLIGKKVGMTQIFKDGARIPVTVVEMGPCTVIQKKTQDGKDGYSALQLGYQDRPHKKTTKAMAGHFLRSDVAPKRFLREFRVETDEAISEYGPGQTLDVSLFGDVTWVDVTGTSKGRGFQGVMRRHNMKGAKQKTHGTHEQFRHVGSIGCRSTPGEVHKGKRLPGQMGNERVTIQNVKVVEIDQEKNLMLLAGSVPGAKNGVVYIRPAVKKAGR